jgi:hypothetical protein
MIAFRHIECYHHARHARIPGVLALGIPASSAHIGCWARLASFFATRGMKAGMTAETDINSTSWKAQMLRLTAFLREPISSDASATLWKTATGQDPVVDDFRPREQIRRQAGPFRECQFDVIIAPRRIDWVIGPRDSTAEKPYFGEAETALDLFKTDGMKWLEMDAAITRIAVGALLLMPSADVKGAYLTLKSKLKNVSVDPVRSSDLFYQVNWPQASKVAPKIRLNRLTKWSALTTRSVQLNIAQTALRPIQSAGSYFCVLECDHNTSEEHTERLGQEEVSSVFGELCRMVIDNARNGEVQAGT